MHIPASFSLESPLFLSWAPRYPHDIYKKYPHQHLIYLLFLHNLAFSLALFGVWLFLFLQIYTHPYHHDLSLFLFLFLMAQPALYPSEDKARTHRSHVLYRLLFHLLLAKLSPEIFLSSLNQAHLQALIH